MQDQSTEDDRPLYPKKWAEDNHGRPRAGYEGHQVCTGGRLHRSVDLRSGVPNWVQGATAKVPVLASQTRRRGLLP